MTAPALVVSPPLRGARWTVALPDGSASELVNPGDGAQVRRAARELNVSEADIRAAILSAQVRVLPPSAPPAGPVVIRGRAEAWDDNAPAPGEFPGMESAIRNSTHALWNWNGTARLAALDVDVNRDAGPSGRFTERDLDYIGTRAAPTPSWSWLTRSSGLRLVFEPCDRFGLSAAERAGLHVLLVPRASYDVRTEKVELLANTRRPPDPAQVRRGVSEYGVADLPGALARRGGAEAVPLGAVETWLDERSMTIGGRYEHERCLIDPGPTSGTPPVTVSEEGVYCFRCAGRRGGGWRSWASLIGEGGGLPETDPIIDSARALAHWTHARLVLTALRPQCPEPLLRLGYRALIRVVHDGRWPDVFERAAGVWDETLAVIRGPGVWLHADTLTVHDAIGPRTLASLPAVRTGAEMERFQTGVELVGYSPIEPVAHLIDRPTWEDGRVLFPRPIVSAEIDAPITYPEARRALASAMGDGIGERWLDTVYLLVVAGLRAQLRRAAPPIAIVTGATRSGKGACVEAARGILGLPVARLRFDGARELSMSIGEGLASGAALLWADEIGKVPDWWHHSSSLLSLSAEHTWRRLHAGTVVSPVRAAVVLVGSTLPRGLTTMSEVAARAVVARLPRVDGDVSARWQARLMATLEVPGLAELRTSPAGSAIATAFVDEARREVLGVRAGSSWPEQAEALGAERVGEDADARELAEVVAALYRLWREGPDEVLIPAGARGAGWLRCWTAGRGDGAADLLAEWTSEDDDPRERAGRLQRLETVSVVDAAGLPSGADVGLLVRSRARRVMARFTSGIDPASLDRRDPRLFPPGTPPPVVASVPV